MARIRSVHPGLFTDEAFVSLSSDAQIFLIGLGTFADYSDQFVWDESRIEKHTGSATSGALLHVLLDAGLITKDGAHGQITFKFGFARKQISKWERLRSLVFKRDGYVCQYCGSKAEPLHCDHRHPVSRGGLSIIENLVTACCRCNLSKNNKTVEEWRA